MTGLHVSGIQQQGGERFAHHPVTEPRVPLRARQEQRRVMTAQPAEVCEIEHPLEILAFEFVQDAGGPDKYRGGMSVRREYRFLEEEAVLQVRADRERFRPYGLYGGRPGNGVVIDVATWTIDETATSRLREQLRAARGWREVPRVSRE